MKNIDKTKKNIGVSKLDEISRKKLYNDFIDAGGEVIKEKKKNGFVDFDREIQKKYKYQLENSKKESVQSKKKSNKNLLNTKPEKKYTEYQTDTETSIDEQLSFKIKPIGKTRQFVQQVRVRLHLFFLKITDLYGLEFNHKFLKNFDIEYKSSLLSVQTTFINIFKQNTRTGKKIIDRLDNTHPIYFELLELLSNVFDRSITNELLEHYLNFPNVAQPTIELREPLTKIFKKLYPLSMYIEYIQKSLERSIELQRKFNNKKSNFYSAKKRKVKNDIYIIFNKLYPRLYWLMCNYEGRIFSSHEEIVNSIPISLDDTPGKRKKPEHQKMIELPFFEQATEIEVEKKPEVLPDPIKDGLNQMHKLNLIKLKTIFDRNDLFKFANENDKVLITYLLFNEFDREYSFILTTNKIKYNIVTDSSEKFDYKEIFSNLYNEMNKCNDRLKNYTNTLIIYEKLRKEKPISNTQYIEYSNRLTAIDKERNQTGADARMHIKAFLDKLCDKLKTIIDDMNDLQKIIANPQDHIIFDSEIEGEKKLGGKKIFKAVNYTYNYVIALAYRLSADGDLSGGLEFKEGEGSILESDIFKKSGAKNRREKISKNKSASKASILEELEDLV